MTDLQKELDQAFKLLAVIPVNGDNVEVMAGIREHLRTAYRLAEPEKVGSDG